jgi:hypothetical protein
MSLRSLARRTADRMALDSSAWGLDGRSAVRIALAPFVAFFGVAATTPIPKLFLWVIDEDMLVESVQAVLLVGVVVLAGLLTGRLFRDRRIVLGGMYLLFTLGAVFLLGEEISWGQRILGLRTPAALEAINAQQEISVHNIHGLHGPSIYAAMAAGAAGTLVPLLGLGLSDEQRRSLPARLLVPPLCLVPAFVMPFAYRFIRLVFQPERYVTLGYGVFVITEFSEFTELSMYFGLFVFVWLNWRLLRRRAEA